MAEKSELAPAVMRAHAAACAEGRSGYLDPVTGLFVMTADHLRDRGPCCGSGCRHCPWGGTGTP